MTDYSELKRLAEAAEFALERLDRPDDLKLELVLRGKSRPDLAELTAIATFWEKSSPGSVLGLIAESERLAEEVELDNKIIAERDRLLNSIPECAAHGQCVPYAIQWVKDIQTEAKELLEERDQLKTENEALRKEAERYRWLRDKQTFIWLIQDWFPSAAEFTDVDAEIDAAMSKGEQA